MGVGPWVCAIHIDTWTPLDVDDFWFPERTRALAECQFMPQRIGNHHHCWVVELWGDAAC